MPKNETNTAKKRKGGRPSKLEPTRVAKLLSAIRSGSYPETAAALAGINKDTLYAWLRIGAEEKSGQFKEFSDSYTEALAQAEQIMVAGVRKAGTAGDWKADAWLLERRFPKRWAKKAPEANVTIETTTREGSTKVTLGDLYRQFNDSSEDI